MSKLKSKQIAWLLFVAVFVLPPSLHFFINIYWWLFDGNILIFEKMVVSTFMTFVGVLVAVIWAETWKYRP